MIKIFFRKCIEIWDTIIELIGINNLIYFLKTDEDDELFIMADVHKKTMVLLDHYISFFHKLLVILINSIKIK